MFKPQRPVAQEGCVLAVMIGRKVVASAEQVSFENGQPTELRSIRCHSVKYNNRSVYSGRGEDKVKHPDGPDVRCRVPSMRSSASCLSGRLVMLDIMLFVTKTTEGCNLRSGKPHSRAPVPISICDSGPGRDETMYLKASVAY